MAEDSVPRPRPDPLSAFVLDGAERSGWSDVVLCVFTSIAEMLSVCGFHVGRDDICVDSLPQYGAMALKSFALSTKDDRDRLCGLEADDTDAAGEAAELVHGVLRMRGGTAAQHRTLGVAVVRCFLAAAGVDLSLADSAQYACQAMDAEIDVRRMQCSPLSACPDVDAIFVAYLSGLAAKAAWRGDGGGAILALPGIGTAA